MRRSNWLLLHGTPLTPAVWNGVEAALASTGDVVTPDLSHTRGTPFAQAWHARKILERLAEGPLDVVGHSFGGHVALEIALAATERVRSLTIVCSRDIPFPAFADAAAALRTSGTIDAEGTLARWFTPVELASGGPVVQYARRCLTAADPCSWADDLDAIATYDRSAEVDALTMPITLIAARGDHVATVDAMAGLASRVQHGRLSVLDGSHMSPFVDPARLVDLLGRARDDA